MKKNLQFIALAIIFGSPLAINSAAQVAGAARKADVSKYTRDSFNYDLFNVPNAPVRADRSYENLSNTGLTKSDSLFNVPNAPVRTYDRSY